MDTNEEKEKQHFRYLIGTIFFNWRVYLSFSRMYRLL